MELTRHLDARSGIARRIRVGRPVAALLVLAALTVTRPSDPVGAQSDGPTAEPAAMELVSRTPGGLPGNANATSAGNAVSEDGRSVSFSSQASDLTASDTNDDWDVFLRDRDAGTTELISVSSDEVQANGQSFGSALSTDLRYVAFTSDATNLVDDDTNLTRDVFVRDRLAGTTTRVSVDSEGEESDGPSYGVTLSGDGRYVGFHSWATNLVEGDTNGSYDVFVHDRATGETTRVSVASDGSEGDADSTYPQISADGQFVTFGSNATTLVGGDTNGYRDAFVHDRSTGVTTRVSVGPGGAEANNEIDEVDISGDGRYISFGTAASNLVPGDTNGRGDVFVHDQLTSETSRVSLGPGLVEADDSSGLPVISTDGRYVAYESDATNLVPDDGNVNTDVFLTDRLTGVTERMSIRLNGVELGPSYWPQVSGDGRVVAFESSSDFIPGPSSFVQVWLRDRGTVDPPGRLRVMTSPAVPATIEVDGIPRDSWGLDWVELDPGPHEVCFGPVPGFTPPACQPVTVHPDQTTTVEGHYAQRGTLRVTTSPAMASTITVDGHPANDWGVWSDLDPGTYEVCFGPVEDFQPPSCEDAVITAGNTTVIDGTFTPDPGAPGAAPGHGYLRALTSPAVASRITIDGHPADTWGLTWLKLDPGTYQVCFEGVLDATAPACEEVVITTGATTTVAGTFPVHGFLKVDTSPALPATISVDGHPVDAWGLWTSRPPGTYDVCFGLVLGYAAPVCQDAVVTAGDTTTVTGTYTPL